MKTARYPFRTLCGIAALACVLALVLVGCGTGNTVTVTNTDAGVTKIAHVGDRIVVRLDGNPSTGYTWTRVAPAGEDFETSPIAIIQEGAWQFPGGGHLAGEPGVCTFEYAVIGTGIVAFSYEYARSWEGEAIQTFSVNILAQE